MSWETEAIVGKEQAFPEAMVAVRMATGERVRYVPERTCISVFADCFCCSECGLHDAYAAAKSFRYCPGCGRKVEHERD